ncbi:hypothetical protein UPYG_G00133500 [Umbra pygmaea]|uniref:Uncharacterized protein n=1 Tax=Umbra pygmaea TaxID=75934 RepID=A0ABD0WTN4_UMBPY
MRGLRTSGVGYRPRILSLKPVQKLYAGYCMVDGEFERARGKIEFELWTLVSDFLYIVLYGKITLSRGGR